MAAVLYDAEEPVLCAQFSPCAAYAHVVAAGTATRLVVLQNGAVSASVRLETRATRLALAPAATRDGLLCAVAGGDRGVHVLQILPESAAPGADMRVSRRGVLRGHTQGVTAVAIDAAGRTLASTGADCTLRLWDAQALQQMTVLRLAAPGVDVQWYPAAGGGGDDVSCVIEGAQAKAEKRRNKSIKETVCGNKTRRRASHGTRPEGTCRGTRSEERGQDHHQL